MHFIIITYPEHKRMYRFEYQSRDMTLMHLINISTPETSSLSLAHCFIRLNLYTSIGEI